ncbi:substrate-binding domain-containing protein [Streptomyces alkaliphilus]|uniref:Substrate-binding domain-containing protein n=1 Tax=Streptomyces alkaliphilus TaxID=1472722 RepID=A0A7W3Y187_9ACTN|nr:LacI family DNA-binding transcriptional regulator [Streptomyces alkaliphilus]MBB0244273.1 substrate-binding domain-containing protein [Streptomyces alkaliphilus]
MTSAHDSAKGDEASGGPLTLAEIAQRTGVSVATVSKVVNGRDNIAPGTRELVEGAIRRHGYRRQKRGGRPAPLLELVFHELNGLYGVEIFHGVQRVARQNGLAVVVTELQGRQMPGRDWVEEVLARRSTGVITVCSGLTEDQNHRLRSRGVPYVLVDPTGAPGHDAASVGAGNWNGGLSATRHLIELGHRRIAVITGAEGVLAARARLDGYRAALDMAGIPSDPDLIRIGNFQIADGLTHTRRLLSLPDPPTAIFASNDHEAIGVYQAAAEAGLRIPGDLSVVGFDDLPTAEWIVPALTTVRQPLREMGGQATTMLLTLARGEPLPVDRMELSTRLVVRNSTAPPTPGGDRGFRVRPVAG